MNKTTMTIATLAAAGTAVLVGGGDASAAENTTSEVSTESTQPTKVTKVTDNQVLDAKKAVDNKKAEVSNTQKEINKAQGTIDNKTEVKKALTEEKGQLTKDIADAKNTTPADVAKIEDSINAQKQNKVDKTKELEQAKVNEATKQATVQEKAKDVEKAQENVTKADKDVEAKKQALDPKAEEIAKDNVAKATADLANKEAKQKEAKANLDEAKAFDADLSEKKVNANADVIVKAKDKEDKTSDVTKATKAQKDAKEAVENAFAYPTKVVTTPEWIKAFKEFKTIDESRFDRDAWRKANPQKPGEDSFAYYEREEAASDQFSDERVAQRKEAVKKVIAADRELRDKYDYNEIIEGYTSKKDNSITYDINNIPSDVLVEASQYFAQLINSAREELGITEKMKVHKDAVEFAKEVAKSVVDNNIKKFGHFGRGINDAARKRGLATSAKPGVDTTSQFYENLAGSNFEGMQITKQQLFHEIYMAANQFLHEGPTTGHYQHAITLVRDKNVGIALSQVEGADFMQIHAIAINPMASNESFYDSVYGPKTLLPNAVYEDKATLQGKLDKANSDLEKAKVELTKATNALDAARAKVAELNTIKTKTPEAQAEYNNAVKAVNDAKVAKDDAESNLRNVTADKATKEKALNDAIKAQDDAKAKLAEIKAVHADAVVEYNKAVDARIAIENTINTIESEIAKLTDEKVELENKIAKRAENEARLVEVNKEIDKLNDEVNKLTVEVSEFKNTEDKLNKELASLEKEYVTLLGIYTAEHMPATPVVDELPAIEIEEFTREEDVEFNTVETEDTTIPVGEKVVKQEGVNGHRVVKVMKFIDNGVLKAIEETVVSEIKPVNKVVAVGVEKPKVNTIGQNATTNVTKPVSHKVTETKVAGATKTTKVGKALPNTGSESTTTVGLGALALLTAVGLRRKNTAK